MQGLFHQRPTTSRTKLPVITEVNACQMSTRTVLSVRVDAFRMPRRGSCLEDHRPTVDLTNKGSQHKAYCHSQCQTWRLQLTAKILNMGETSFYDVLGVSNTATKIQAGLLCPAAAYAADPA